MAYTKRVRAMNVIQTLNDVLVEVLIDEKRDHGIKPFALARARSSSLLTPGGCDASI
jgi:hypothetical protein